MNPSKDVWNYLTSKWRLEHRCHRATGRKERRGVINGWSSHTKWRPLNETTEKWAGVVSDADYFQLHFPLAMILVCAVLYVTVDAVKRRLLDQCSALLLGSMASPALGLANQHQVNTKCRFWRGSCSGDTHQRIRPCKITHRNAPHVSRLSLNNTEQVFTIVLRDYPGRITSAHAWERHRFFSVLIFLIPVVNIIAVIKMNVLTFFLVLYLLYWQNMCFG